jgi:hypothetical protein
MSAAAEPIEVNGKVALGIRRLVVSHVENAASFYAYQEATAGFMKEIVATCLEHSQQLSSLKEMPKLLQVTIIYPRCKNFKILS